MSRMNDELEWRLLLRPGTASAEELAELWNEMSELSEAAGGPALRFEVGKSFGSGAVEIIVKPAVEKILYCAGCGTTLTDGYCLLCRTSPDMQSTEIRRERSH